MNVLSLFDGMSCGQLALNRTGVEYENYFACEIDKYAIKVTQSNFPKTIQLGDVTKVKGNDLPKIDLLIGGSPCQGFSSSNISDLNFNHPKSVLFFEYIRVLKESKPRYFLLENVKMKREYQNIISSYLGVEPVLINSALVSAQNRERLYWTNIPNVTQPEDKGITLLTACCKGRNPRIIVRPAKMKSNCLTASYYKGVNADSRPFLARESAIGLTYREGKDKIRMFTPSECEALQTVPIGYTDCGISKTQRYKMLGNGWTVDVIAHILKNAL